MTGIYKITNLLDGHAYIGQSIDIENRWKCHLYAGRKFQKKCRSPLYRAMNRDGVENFSFEILEECEINKMPEREIFWISELHTNRAKGEDGYNLCAGGGCQANWIEQHSIAQFGKKHTVETKTKISNSHKGKAKSAEHRKHISDANKGRIKPQSQQELEKRRKTIVWRQRRVIQCNLQGEEIQRFASLAKAREWLRNNGFPKAGNSGIRANLDGTRNKAFGFIWKDEQQWVKGQNKNEQS